MEEHTSDPQLWSWSEKAIASLYWSEEECAWRWAVTRQKAGEWTRWRSGDERTCSDACLYLADAFEALADDEGEPF